MRRLAILIVGLVAVAGSAAIALAVVGGSGRGYAPIGPFINDDQNDVTTCGEIWANGKVSNSYKVFPRRPDGSYFVYEEIASQLRTLEGQSVGACNNGAPDNGNTVGAGIKVRVSSLATWIVRNGSFDPEATCVSANPACFIPAFTRSFFGTAATFEGVDDISLYETRCNGSWTGGPFVAGESAGDITGPKSGCDD
jgi:hypothetical protein